MFRPRVRIRAYSNTFRSVAAGRPEKISFSPKSSGVQGAAIDIGQYPSEIQGFALAQRRRDENREI
jgi:hypothetical protein